MTKNSHEKKSVGIMVVDDDESLRLSITRALTRAGYNVNAVPNGSECLEGLRKGFKGIILMDVVMPVMDGWTTIQNIVNESLLDGSVICMVTGQTEPPPIGMALEPYITDYLAKPFDTKDLLAMVKTAALHLDGGVNSEVP